MASRKRTYIGITTVFILAVILYLASTNSTYAFRSFPSMPKLYKQSAGYSISNDPRDVKLPDETTNSFRIKPWKGPKLVFIDPGHGGMDPGAVVANLKEKDICLDIALRLNAILKNANVQTILTRSEDTFSDPKDRIKAANEKNAALYLSIHCNWFENTSRKGVMTLYNPSDALRAGFLTESSYTAIIHNKLLQNLETKDGGKVERPNLSVLKRAKMPSVLVETGFLSNKEEASLLAAPEYRQKCAQALAEGVIRALNKMD